MRQPFARTVGQLVPILGLAVVLWAVPAFAIPTLQLDILGGTYDSGTQTIVAQSDPFTLYALLRPDSRNPLSDWYYVSASILPEIGPPGADLGSFVFDGMTIAATADMIYGVPPMESVVTRQGWDRGDLPRHGIFATYFSEFAFQFSPANRAALYNTQDDAGAGPTPDPLGSLYYAAFTVDVSGLDPGYALHFDLYNSKLLRSGDIDITQFAPFSHDAESMPTPIPEPSTLLLLAPAIAGVGLWGHRRAVTRT
jgi:hypothetical protein